MSHLGSTIVNRFCTFVGILKAHSVAIVRNAIAVNYLTKKLDIVSPSYAKPDSKPVPEANVWMWTNVPRELGIICISSYFYTESSLFHSMDSKRIEKVDFENASRLEGLLSYRTPLRSSGIVGFFFFFCRNSVIKGCRSEDKTNQVLVCLF